ncbi:MAG TPA: IPT/TIG domain-containing protein [Thermoanaerobaculia bacterium]|jgi:hypothetical protein
MKRLFSLAVLLLLSTTTFADSLPVPVISTVTPASGPSSGGNDVVITGSGFSTNVVCILPCPPVITFGDVEVPAKEESDNRLVVTAPPHPAGTVDLTVRMADGRKVTAPDAYTFTAGAEDAWEKVLLPIYFDGPVSGGGGSRWQTEFWVRNNGDEPVDLAPWPCLDSFACPAVVPLTYSLAAGTTLRNLPPFFRAPSANPSRLLYVRRNQAENVSMNLRVADLSRSTANAGTELPVVRGDEYETRAVNLLNVPYDPPRFRMHLRVYDVALTQSRFRVTLYAQAEGATTQVEHSVELTATTIETGDFRTQAAFAEYNFAELELLDKVWPKAFRIEVTPLSPGSRFYPLVSVTNNDTQLITLVTPQ